MTKAELIAALSELDDNADVVIADAIGNECHIDSVAVEDTGVIYIDGNYHITDEE